MSPLDWTNLDSHGKWSRGVDSINSNSGSRESESTPKNLEPNTPTLNATLTGNWSEEWLDTRRTVALRRPLPHQFSHYFETTYYSSYKKDDVQPIYTTPKRESRNFPGHQPELDPPHTKCATDWTLK